MSTQEPTKVIAIVGYARVHAEANCQDITTVAACKRKRNPECEGQQASELNDPLNGQHAGFYDEQRQLNGQLSGQPNGHHTRQRQGQPTR